MTYLISYIALIFFFQILCLFMVKDEYTIKPFIIGTYIWPISILLVLFVLGLDKVNWDFDIVKAKKIFWFRKPRDNWPGFAITIFYIEFQFWKKRD